MFGLPINFSTILVLVVLISIPQIIQFITLQRVIHGYQMNINERIDQLERKKRVINIKNVEIEILEKRIEKLEKMVNTGEKREMEDVVAFKSPFSQKRLAIIIVKMVKDYDKELNQFLKYLKTFLKNLSNFHIFIVEQMNLKLNRGQLFNIGFKSVSKDYDYIIFHDFNLLPTSLANMYEYNDYPLIRNLKYNEMVIQMKREHFEIINGFSNEYYEYSNENLDLIQRLKLNKIPIQELSNMRYIKLFENSHRNNTLKLCKGDGLINIQYNLVKEEKFDYYTRLYVSLKNDLKINCDESQKIIYISTFWNKFINWENHQFNLKIEKEKTNQFILEKQEGFYYLKHGDLYLSSLNNQVQLSNQPEKIRLNQVNEKYGIILTGGYLSVNEKGELSLSAHLKDWEQFELKNL